MTSTLDMMSAKNEMNLSIFQKGKKWKKIIKSNLKARILSKFSNFKANFFQSKNSEKRKQNECTACNLWFQFWHTQRNITGDLLTTISI